MKLKIMLKNLDYLGCVKIYTDPFETAENKVQIAFIIPQLSIMLNDSVND